MRTSNMLAIAGLLASLLALSTSPILASPISSSSVKRQAGVQVVNTCANQGQMAMTFDGMSRLLPSPHTRLGSQDQLAGRRGSDHGERARIEHTTQRNADE